MSKIKDGFLFAIGAILGYLVFATIGAILIGIAGYFVYNYMF